jgi:hypothetical protein
VASFDLVRQHRAYDGPKADGTYLVEFRTAAGEALSISVPRGETAVVKHFQERMPFMGCFVPDVD